MSKPSQTDDFADLLQQARYLPRGKGLRCLQAAEDACDALLGQCDVEFTHHQLWQNLLGRPAPEQGDTPINILSLRLLLTELIETLSRQLAPLPEHTLSGKELAEKWQIATKTLQRWRNQENLGGIRWRWGRPSSGGRPQIIYTDSAIATFANAFPERVAAATAFSPLSPKEKRTIIRRARRLALATDCSPNTCAAHLSKRLNRSQEGIRQLLLKHDARNPTQAIFPSWRPPLKEADHKQVYQAWSQGIAIQTICKRMRRTRATIYRSILAARAEQVLAMALPATADIPTMDKPPQAMSPTPTQTATALVPPLLIPWLSFMPWDEAQLRHMLLRWRYLASRVENYRERLGRGIIKSHSLEKAELALAQFLDCQALLLLGICPIVIATLTDHARTPKALVEQLLAVMPGIESALDTLQSQKGALWQQIQTLTTALSSQAITPDIRHPEKLLRAWFATRLEEAAATQLSGHAAPRYDVAYPTPILTPYKVETMANIPEDRKYLASHEWHKQDGEFVYIGISQVAVDELTDITYFEFLADGSVQQNQPFGEVESVKATSEVYAGIDGEIVEINQAVLEDPSLLNRDCYQEGWLIKIIATHPDQLDALLDAATYTSQAS